jgi:hypothetical protein
MNEAKRFAVNGEHVRQLFSKSVLKFIYCNITQIHLFENIFIVFSYVDFYSQRALFNIIVIFWFKCIVGF